MKMIKKVLIAIALVALLGVTVQAQVTTNTDSGGFVKFDSQTAFQPQKIEVWWPYEITYKPIPICCIPVKIEIGMYAELFDCANKKILLKQVDCASISKGTGDFPCYFGCTNIDLRANFQACLGTTLTKALVGGKNIIDQWSAAFAAPTAPFKGTPLVGPYDVIPGDGAWYTTAVCVKAWSADIFYAQAGCEVGPVGFVCITVKPCVGPGPGTPICP